MKQKLVIEGTIWDKLMFSAKKANNLEVSGLGKVVAEKGVFKLISATLLPQKNTGTTTDIEGEDVAKAMYALRETPGELTCWWHSHAHMDVFWSGTDRDTMKQVAIGGYCLALVINAKNQAKAALYIKNAYGENNKFFPNEDVFIDDLTVEISREVDPALVAQWEAEYTANVQTQSWRHNWGNNSVGESQAGGKKLSRKERRKLKKVQHQLQLLGTPRSQRADGTGNSKITIGTGGTSDDKEEVQSLYCRHCGRFREHCVCDYESNECKYCELPLYMCVCDEDAGLDADSSEPCPLCGYTAACSCDPSEKQMARYLMAQEEEDEARGNRLAPKGPPPNRGGKTGGW